MNIKLNVKKNTFEQYLLELGYNYRIKEYDDFIIAFGGAIQRLVYDSINNGNLKETVNKVFEKDIGILFLSNLYNIKHIRESFLKEVIKEEVFSVFLDKEDISIEDDVLDAIYLKSRIENLDFEKYSDTKRYLKESDEFRSIFIKNSSIDKKIKKLNNISKLEVTEEKQRELDQDIKDVIININKEIFREDITFELNRYGFNNGTNLNIDFFRLREYIYIKVKERLSLDEEIEGCFILNYKDAKKDESVRSEINKRLFNIREEDKEGLINVISFLNDSDYNKESYTGSAFNYLEHNSPKIYWSDFNQGTTIFDKLNNLEEFKYISEMKDLISKVLKVVSFDIIVKVNGETITIPFKEMTDHLLVSR